MGRWSVGTAVILNEWIGQREGDVLGMLRSAYQDGALRFEQSKTKVDIDLPVDLVPHLFQRMCEEAARWAARKVTPTTLIASEATGQPYRSEEHTSELQSLMRTSYAVFCLK